MKKEKTLKEERAEADDRYFRYWMRFLGHDIMEVFTGKVITKGEFYRKNTKLAESLADKAIELPVKYQLIKRVES